MNNKLNELMAEKVMGWELLSDGRLEELISACTPIFDDKQTNDTVENIKIALKELQSLRKENEQQHITTRKDLKIIGKLRKQNKALREDGERLAKMVEILSAFYPNDDDIDALEQHKALMERIEKENG